MKRDLYLKNDQSHTESASVSITVQRCDNKTAARGIVCATPAEIDKFASDFEFSTWVIQE